MYTVFLITGVQEEFMPLQKDKLYIPTASIFMALGDK